MGIEPTTYSLRGIRCNPHDALTSIRGTAQRSGRTERTVGTETVSHELSHASGRVHTPTSALYAHIPRQ